jgi:hypothetical protein
MKEVGKEELQQTLQSFQRDKSPRPDGLPVEFFLGCYEFIEEDLRRVVEATRTTSRMLGAFNTTFIARIPKEDNLTSFEKFRPISLCNCIYKIISKVISKRLKRVLSKQISGEQFGFLEGRQIHEVVEIAQEILHSIKIRSQRVMVIKVDLSKAYDRVSWLYLRPMLIHLGFYHQFVVWMMSCITSVSFAILINGVHPYSSDQVGV